MNTNWNGNILLTTDDDTPDNRGTTLQQSFNYTILVTCCYEYRGINTYTVIGQGTEKLEYRMPRFKPMTW